MADEYKFRREDNGEIVEVDFRTAIEAHHGWITLPDGVEAKRVHDSPLRARETCVKTGSRAIVSDSMGFCDFQLQDFEADRKANGFTDVEFVRDPAVPGFMQVKCGSRDTYNKYAAHRGYDNKNSMGGMRLSEEDMARAVDFVMDKYGSGEDVIDVQS